MSPKRKSKSNSKTGKQPVRPTESEQEILNVLWDLGEATVRQIHTKLAEDRDIGYTTVLKLMQIMTEKGLLVRDQSQRSHVYRAKHAAETTQQQLLKDFMARVFGGSTEKLVMQALSNKKATPQELAKIQKILDKMEDK